MILAHLGELTAEAACIPSIRLGAAEPCTSAEELTAETTGKELPEICCAAEYIAFSLFGNPADVVEMVAASLTAGVIDADGTGGVADGLAALPAAICAPGAETAAISVIMMRYRSFLSNVSESYHECKGESGQLDDINSHDKGKHSCIDKTRLAAIILSDHRVERVTKVSTW